MPRATVLGFAVAHTLAIYGWLIVALRLIGRRQMAQLTPMEICVIALLGSAVETGLYSGSGSLLVGLAAAATLLLMNRGFAWLVHRWPRLRWLIAGEPIVLVRHGRLLPAQLRRAHLTRGNLFQALRARGYDSFEGLSVVMLEVNGEITALPAEEEA